ncbi:retrotransposon protein [Tanacetum coccineum]
MGVNSLVTQPGGTTFQGGDKELLGVQGDDGGGRVVADSQGVSDEDIDEEDAEFGNNGGENSKQKGACYNSGIEGHFASECRKLKDNKAFMGGAWSDSEDGYEHQNDATCLMAIDSNEVVSKSSSSSIDLNIIDLQKENVKLLKYDGRHVIFESNLKGKVVGGGNITHDSITITNVEL